MENIRRTWEEMGERLENRDESGSDHGNSDYGRYRRETALEKLKRKYLTFSTMALIFIFVWPCSLFNLRDLVGDWLWPLLIIFSLYFAVCSAMDYWLYKGIGTIDCYTMTVKDVIEKAYYYRKMHLRFIAILLPIAFICIGSLGWVMREEPYIIAGMLFGGILGFVLGYRQYLDFMSEYRRLRD